MRYFIQYIILLSILYLGSYVNAKCSDTTNVLFIGNSITLYNDLPDLFERISNSNDKKVNSVNAAIGGTLLEEHLEIDITLEPFNQYNWDIVVLQLTGNEFGIIDSYSTILAWDKLIHEQNECCQTILFIPWSLNGFHTNTIRNQAIDYANNINAKLIPAGPVWRDIERDTTGYIFYQDIIHPTLTGSYIAACATYCSIFNESCEDIQFNSTLNEKDVSYFQKMASNHILNNLDVYNIRCKADFEYENENLKIELESLTTNALNYFWDFGDGNTSYDQNPKHTYSEEGNYTISFIVEDNTCDRKKDTIQKSIEIIKNSENQFVKISPVPILSELHINFDKVYYKIYINLFNSNGRIILSKVYYSTDNIILPVTDLSSGIYYIHIKDDYYFSVNKPLLKLK